MFANAFGVRQEALQFEVFSRLYPVGVGHYSPGLAPCAYPGRTDGTPEPLILLALGLCGAPPSAWGKVVPLPQSLKILQSRISLAERYSDDALDELRLGIRIGLA